MAGDEKEAQELYEKIVRDFPENLGASASLASLSFKRGELDKAEFLCRRINEKALRADAVELLSRIWWMKHEREKAVDIYEKFLNPTVDMILQEKADELGVPLPSGEDERSFWDIVSFVPNEGNAISRQVMAPLFMAGMNDPKWLEIKKLAAGQYARYRWQDKFAEELKARRYVQRGEYFLAAKQYESFASRYPDDLSIQYDLAGVYSRLGRLGDEAVLYDSLAEKQVYYPELAANAERIRIKQRPYAEVEYGFDRQEGYHAYKDMEKDWYGLSAWYSPWSRSEMVISAERYNYQATSMDLKARANRLLGLYKVSLMPGVATFISAGLHSIDNGDAGRVLFSFGFNGKMGDKLSGRVALNRDVVDDTIASLTREIVRESLEGGLSLDLLPRLEVGGDYSYTNFSDNNWTTGYSLRSSYTLFSEPTFLQLRYAYDFKESQEAEVGGVVLRDGFASDDHPYWAPKNYWQNSFGCFFKHTFGQDLLDRGTPRYYTAEYYFGHDSNGYAFQTLKGATFAEITPEITLKGSFELSSSQSFRRKLMALSAVYRW
jgi:tetratricopeptide (TPR) repeat protein